MKQDSIDFDSIPTPPPPPPGLPPDETRIRGKVISVQRAGGRLMLQFEVIDFLGSGSSAPVVMPQDTITVKAPALQRQLKKDTWYIVDLEYRQVLAKYKESASPWLLISIEKSSKPQP